MQEIQTAVNFIESRGGQVIGVSGHRPQKLGGYGPRVTTRLNQWADAILKRHSPSVVISGMALGVDQAVAQACIRANIPFIAAIPFEGQEKAWPQPSQKTYHALRDAAACVVFSGTRNDLDKRGAAFLLNKRNEDMLEILLNASGGTLVALWDGSSSGTGNCVRSANERGIPVVNYWGSWLKYVDR